MLRQFTRLPLRRGLHSQATSSPRLFARYTRSAYALGATVTVAGYFAWSWSSDTRYISLDAEAIPAPQKKTGSPRHIDTSRVPDVPARSPSQGNTSEPPTISTEGSEPSPAQLEASAEGEETQGESSGGAFNPETGEINWDCPCLGGMAHGPCGPQFREAFSCFVHSEADPKGIDCVEKFKAMQECFREHPDVYGDEIMDDEDEETLAESMTVEKKGDLQPSDNVPPDTTSTPVSP